MSPQPKKGRPGGSPKKGAPTARQRFEERRQAHKRLALVVFAVFVVGSFVVVAIAQGVGGGDLPEDAIAVVEEAPDSTITSEDFDRSLVQTAARQGLREAPPEDDPQYEPLADAATSDLILSRWVLGEAAERGIEVSDRELDEELEAVKQQQFESEQAFDKFLDDSGFTLEEARARIELQLVSDRIQREVLPQEPAVSEDEVRTFYNENIAQFQTPESRDVRVVLTKTESEAAEALAALEQDPSPQGFDQVAKEFSTDEATKDTGGLREAVIEGQSEPALDEALFAAPEGELSGPIEADAGFYVFQVEKITPAKTTALSEARPQILDSLRSARQQEIAADFQDDFQSKWRARTICAEGYQVDNCSNPEAPPDPCTEKVATEQGCEAPVPSTRPVAPGSVGVFGTPAPQGLPQGPITDQPALPGGLPPGLSPLPGAPPGTAPPGAPPGTAPPGTPPPTPPGG